MKQKVQFSFSTDFQAEVLKYLLRDPEGGLALKRLKPNYFVLIEHSIIAEGIFSYYKKKKRIPSENILKQVIKELLESKDYADLVTTEDIPGINKVVIITKLSRYDKIKRALNELGVTGITVTQVSGCGIQKGTGEMYRGVEMDMTLLPKIKLEVVVSGIPVDSVIETAKKTLYTGKIGDGKIFVYPVSRVVKIRTGEENYDALQDVE